ncbi:MAG: metal-dependent transcriptional regulator [Anaerolineaceae bacterium]|nr:metal-dependent transcriptional regulator [Anaerolineaceae bacterium]
MENQQPTPTIEDYLSLIFSIAFDNEKITGAKLAEYLGVSAPTVTATLQRMERDDWIAVADKKQINLTNKGRSAALAVVQRHNLVECLLYETLGMPLSSIHDEAHRIEHAISAETQTYLSDKFSDAAFSPFGMPINGQNTGISNWKPLLSANTADKLIIRRIIHYHCTREALQFLENNRLLPGEPIQVIEHHDFNQTFTIQTEHDQQEISVGYPIARMIQVEKK